jgi:cytochrome c
MPRRATIFGLAALSLTLATPACGDQTTVEIGEGRKLVAERCGACHGTVRGQVSPHGSAPPFEEVVKLYPPESLAEALAEGIFVGHEDMPAFEFSPEEIERIIAHLKSLE